LHIEAARKCYFDSSRAGVPDGKQAVHRDVEEGDCK
jgi:hypothetical protein